MAAFAAFGVFWGAWGGVIPQIRYAAHVTSGTLGVNLLFIGAGAMCSMQVRRIADRLAGPARPARVHVGVLISICGRRTALGLVALVAVALGTLAGQAAVPTAS